jgi:hypothetical protein
MAGVTLIGYLLLFYFYDKNIMLGVPVRWSALLVYAGYMFLGAQKVVREDFQVVLRTAFGIFIVTNVFYYLFDYALFNHFDTALINIDKKIMEDYFVPNAKTIEEARNLTDAIRDTNYHGFSELTKSFAKGAIGGFGLSILISYLVKKV